MSPKTGICGESIALGKRLAAVRRRRRMSQTEVSEQTGVHRTVISDIERGKRKVYALELRDLCKVYKVSPSFLLNGSIDEDLFDVLIRLDRDAQRAVAKYIQYIQWHKAQRNGRIASRLLAR